MVAQFYLIYYYYYPLIYNIELNKINSIQFNLIYYEQKLIYYLTNI